MIAPPPACTWCKHFRSHSIGTTCDAFPNGIPEHILDDVSIHYTPVDGDHGMTFELSDDMPPGLFRRLHGALPGEHQDTRKT